jgi:DNA replication protein DnaC
MACEFCDDTGWKPVEHDGVRRVVRCDCWYMHVGEKLLSEARIPPLYKRCDLDNFRDYNDTLVRAVGTARAFCNAFPAVQKGLLFIGKPGLGKTHLAAATLRRVIQQTNVRGLFYTTPELLTLIKSTYNTATKSSESDIIRPIMEAHLLVLDDLGAERPTDWVEETMNLIVNTRYNYKRATIFTSNYPLEIATAPSPDDKDWARFDLKERVGFRLFSRLHEMCEFLTLEGVDYRELGPDASAERLAALSAKGSQTHADPSRRPKPMAKARLKSGTLDLGWTGGKAGS